MFICSCLGAGVSFGGLVLVSGFGGGLFNVRCSQEALAHF